MATPFGDFNVCCDQNMCMTVGTYLIDLATYSMLVIQARVGAMRRDVGFVVRTRIKGKKQAKDQGQLTSP